MLNVTRASAEYSQKAIEAIKGQVGSGTQTTTQGFAEPDQSTDASKIADKLIADSGVKFD